MRKEYGYSFPATKLHFMFYRDCVKSTRDNDTGPVKHLFDSEFEWSRVDGLLFFSLFYVSLPKHVVKTAYYAIPTGSISPSYRVL